MNRDLRMRGSVLALLACWLVSGCGGVANPDAGADATMGDGGNDPLAQCVPLRPCGPTNPCAEPCGTCMAATVRVVADAGSMVRSLTDSMCVPTQRTATPPLLRGAVTCNSPEYVAYAFDEFDPDAVCVETRACLALVRAAQSQLLPDEQPRRCIADSVRVIETISIIPEECRQSDRDVVCFRGCPCASPHVCAFCSETGEGLSAGICIPPTDFATDQSLPCHSDSPLCPSGQRCFVTPTVSSPWPGICVPLDRCMAWAAASHSIFPLGWCSQ